MASNAGTVSVKLVAGKCRTCKHWANIPQPMRGCLRVEGYIAQEADDLFAVDGASDRDGDGYFPCVVTGPEFGCVHWEAK